MNALDAAIRAARDPARGATPEPERLEVEIFPDGRARSILTVYLRNGACPIACVYCALYRGMDARPATGEEIAVQIASARARHEGIAGIKLYNASSFFEPASIVPSEAELRAIASEVAGLDLVVVEARSENAARAPELARRLDGRLEVAIGMEAADDELLALWNKPTSTASFRKAARLLAANGILLRAFVLVQPPFVSGREARELAIRSVEEAAAAGARLVSLLPVVSRHAPMEKLRRAGMFSEVSLDLYFEIVSACRGRGPAIVAETEALAALPGCRHCRDRRIAALLALNETGELPAVDCERHEAAPERTVVRPSVAAAVSVLR